MIALSGAGHAQLTHLACRTPADCFQGATGPEAPFGG